MSGVAESAHPLIELARYGAVVVVGLGLDVGLGYGVHQLLGLPLVVSAAISFLTCVAVNYVLFELWVFRTGRMTWRRLGNAYMAAQGAFVVRLASVWVLTRIMVWLAPNLPHAALGVLIAAAGFSFIVNFVLLKRFLRH